MAQEKGELVRVYCKVCSLLGLQTGRTSMDWEDLVFHLAPACWPWWRANRAR